MGRRIPKEPKFLCTQQDIPLWRSLRAVFLRVVAQQLELLFQIFASALAIPIHLPAIECYFQEVR